MTNSPITISRMKVGLIALGLLVAAVFLSLFQLEGNNDMWSGACLKVGLVMGALWLALPSFTRREEFGKASWQVIVGALLAALLVARARISLQVLVPFLIVAATLIRILRPREARPVRPKRFDDPPNKSIG